MNKFTFFAAIAIATTMMVGCDDNEEQLVPELSINLENGVLNVSNEGETATVSCTINNPVEGGTLSATTEADWLTLNCNNTDIVVEAVANEIFEPKSATVNVTYTYGDNQTLSGQFTVEQEARAIPDADYSLENPYVGGRMASMMGMTYFDLTISEQEIPEDFDLPYNPDYIYYKVGIFDVENDKPVAGTYTLGSENRSINVAAYGTPDAPYYNALSSGTLTISYEEQTLTLVAIMTDGYGKIHFINYTGIPMFI